MKDWDEVDYSGWTESELKAAKEGPWLALRIYFINLKPDPKRTAGTVAGQVLRLLKDQGYEV